MQVNGPSNLHGAQNVNGPNAARSAEQATQTSQPNSADEVSISQQADFLSRIDDIPDIRQERVDAIRAEIANGTYETDEKIGIAVERLLDEIA